MINKPINTMQSIFSCLFSSMLYFFFGISLPTKKNTYYYILGNYIVYLKRVRKNVYDEIFYFKEQK